MDYLIGIDVGTTNIKAIIFDESGGITAQAMASTPMHRSQADHTFYNASELWELTAGLLSKAAAQAGKNVTYHVRGIAVTGMGEAGVPLDDAGTPLYHIIPWFDLRTASYVDTWDSLPGERGITEITGLRCQHIFTANKLCWLRDQQPEAFLRMRRWHCVPDYITYCMTGESVIDRSLASRTMLMDLKTGRWSSGILKQIGMPENILPTIVPSGTKAGHLSGKSAGMCGLPAGIPVFAGGHDHICGALASGTMSEGQILDSSGTSEEILTAACSVERALDFGRKGFNIGWHTARDRLYLAGGLPASGISVDWGRKLFNNGAYDSSIPGANGALFLPHLRGGSSPERNPASHGVFLGLRDTITGPDLMQAIYEGLSFEIRMLSEILLDGKKPSRIVTIGGGAKNSRWVQIKANILGIPVEVPTVGESTALGAALLAGIGAGVYSSEREALEKTYHLQQMFTPDTRTFQLYEERYATFSQLCQTVFPLNKSL